MDEIAIGAILKRITTGLEASRANIKTWSDQIAELDVEATERQDDINQFNAEAFVEAATELNTNGKLVNPNIDSQKAAVIVKLSRSDSYESMRMMHRELLKKIQIKKNAIVCEHERRGDLKTEVELLRLLDGSG